MPIEPTGCDGPARAGTWLRLTGSGLDQVEMVSTTDHDMLNFEPQVDGSIAVLLPVWFEGPKELVFHDITGRYFFKVDVEPPDGQAAPAPASAEGLEEPMAEIDAEPPRPIVDKVEPSSFPSGPATLKLSGANFTIAEEVLVGGTAVQPNILSDNELTIDLTEAPPGQHEVVVKTWSNMTSEPVAVSVN